MNQIIGCFGCLAYQQTEEYKNLPEDTKSAMVQASFLDREIFIFKSLLLCRECMVVMITVNETSARGKALSKAINCAYAFEIDAVVG